MHVYVERVYILFPLALLFFPSRSDVLAVLHEIRDRGRFSFITAWMAIKTQHQHRLGRPCLRLPAEHQYVSRGELPGLGPLTINLNIDAKTNGIYVNNIII